MCRLVRGMMIAAVVLALTGCSMGKLSMGSLSPSDHNEYQIFGSNFDKSFQLAYQAIQESNLEIYDSNKDTGKIAARINIRTDSMQGDLRDFATVSAELKFSLRKTEAGNLLFAIDSKSNMGGQKYIDKFMEKYSRYVSFTEIGHDNPMFTEKKIETDNATMSENIVSEARTVDPTSPVKRHEFSQDDIIEIQNLLNKLGYDPGPADGAINSKTRAAIEKFKVDLNP